MGSGMQDCGTGGHVRGWCLEDFGGLGWFERGIAFMGVPLYYEYIDRTRNVLRDLGEILY